MSAGLRPVAGDLADLVPLVREWLDGDDPLWIRTSGSTGRPKDVVLSPRAVRASAAATHAVPTRDAEIGPADEAGFAPFR